MMSEENQSQCVSNEETLKQQAAHIRPLSQRANAETVQYDADEDIGVWKTLVNNPIVILCALYGNIGALMYGFDNITLSLCLDMPAFV